MLQLRCNTAGGFFRACHVPNTCCCVWLLLITCSPTEEMPTGGAALEQMPNLKPYAAAYLQHSCAVAVPVICITSLLTLLLLIACSPREEMPKVGSGLDLYCAPERTCHMHRTSSHAALFLITCSPGEEMPKGGAALEQMPQRKPYAAADLQHS
jgi:hypothetical protein